MLFVAEHFLLELQYKTTSPSRCLARIQKIHCVLKHMCSETHTVHTHNDNTLIKTHLCPHIHNHTLILHSYLCLIVFIVLSTAGLFVLLICLSQWLLSSGLLYSWAKLADSSVCGLCGPFLLLSFNSLYPHKPQGNRLVFCNSMLGES